MYANHRLVGKPSTDRACDPNGRHNEANGIDPTAALRKKIADILDQGLSGNDDAAARRGRRIRAQRIRSRRAPGVSGRAVAPAFGGRDTSRHAAR